MGLFKELLKEVWRREDDLRGLRVTKIRIHPEWFDRLVADKEIIGTIQLDKDGVKLNGIPLIKTPDVEKWEFVI